MTVGGTIRLWLFIISAIAGGLFTCGSGLDWKGGVVLCKRIGCSLLQSIFSLNLVSELPIEVFSSFGTTRITCWPLFFATRAFGFAAMWLKFN